MSPTEARELVMVIDDLKRITALYARAANRAYTQDVQARIRRNVIELREVVNLTLAGRYGLTAATAWRDAARLHLKGLSR